MRLQALPALLIVVLLLFLTTTALAKKDVCKHRQKVNWLKQITHSQHRLVVKIKKAKAVQASNGVYRTLTVGQPFHFCGCTKSGSCVLYDDSPQYRNADGTTFFANVPASILGIKKGKTLFGRWLGAKKPSIRVKEQHVRALRTYDLRTADPYVIHGGPKEYIASQPMGGAPMWEYTWLGQGLFVTGAESPASWWVKGQKIGRGFNTGLFNPKKDKFHDLCLSKVKTYVRRYGEIYPGPWTGSGTVSWVFGYVQGTKTRSKVYAWMIEKIDIAPRDPGVPRPYPGNIY